MRDSGGWRCAFAVCLLIAAVICTFTAQRAVAQSGIPCRYLISHIIQAPPGTLPFEIPTTVATGISPNGRYVCGRYVYVTDDLPFIYDTQTQQFMTLPMPPGIYSASLADINDNGIAVGTSLRTNIGQRGFVYDLHSGTWTELLPLPGGVWSAATGVNANNVVCGWRSIGPGTNPQTAYRWSAKAGFEDVGLIGGNSTSAWGISESNTITGYTGQSTLQTATRAFVFGDGGLIVLPPVRGGINSYSRGIGPLNQVLVLGLLEPAPTVLQHTFLYENGQFIELQVPTGCDRTYSDEMNGQWVSVGGCNDLPTGTWRGVVWHGTTPRVLNTMIDGDLGLYVRVAVDVSEGGLIAAEVRNMTGDILSVVFSPIPRVLGDTNCDELVGVRDLLNVINAWGPCNSCDEDFNDDEQVNLQDLMDVIFNWSG